MADVKPLKIGADGLIAEIGGTDTISPTIAPGSGGGGGSPVVIRPAQITANQNGYAPTDFATATHVFFSGDVSFRQIRGFDSTGISDGESKVLFNTGLYPVVLVCEHASATAANRITGPQNYVIQPGETGEAIYDATAARWRVVMSPNAVVVGREYRVPMGSQFNADWGHITMSASGGGTISTVKPTALLPGGILLGTGTTATGGYFVAAGKTEPPFFKGGGHMFMDTLLVTPTTLSDAAERYSIGAGFANNGTGSPLDTNSSVGLVYNDVLGTDWQIVHVTNAGVKTYVPTGVTVQAGTVYRLRIEVPREGIEAQAWINGVQVGTIKPAAFFPNNDLFARAGILKAIGTTQRTTVIASIHAAIYNSF